VHTECALQIFKRTLNVHIKFWRTLSEHFNFLRTLSMGLKNKIATMSLNLQNKQFFPSLSPNQIGFIDVKKIEIENLTLGHLWRKAEPPVAWLIHLY